MSTYLLLNLAISKEGLLWNGQLIHSCLKILISVIWIYDTLKTIINSQQKRNVDRYLILHFYRHGWVKHLWQLKSGLFFINELHGCKSFSMKKVSNYMLMLLFLIFSNFCISNGFQEKWPKKTWCLQGSTLWKTSQAQQG